MRLPVECKKPSSIFDYLDYRSFLRDVFAYKKASSGFSYREFARAAGMNSSSWLLHLIKGAKNLSADSSRVVAQALSLGPGESEYFDLLVQFSQAKTSAEKSRCYEEMLSFKKHRGIASIDEKQYEYYTRWYYPVIRSLVNKLQFGEDYSLLAAHVVPAITARQAAQAVGLLKRFGMIVQDGSGEWQQTDPVISTGDEVHSLKVVNYHRQVAELARDAYDHSSAEEREIAAMTVGIGEKEFVKIRDRLREFRREIIDIVGGADTTDRVYQLNLQFFPVSTQCRQSASPKSKSRRKRSAGV